MASRMERYYQNSEHFEGRSKKNKNIYKQIQDLDTYSNIEGVVSIRNNNEVDISKVKELINSREGYKKEKRIQQAIKNSPLRVTEENDNNKMSYDVLDLKPDKMEEIQKEKNYDLVDVISRAKEDSGIKPDKNRSLKNTNYEEMNTLNLRKEEFKDSEEELKELINTITHKKNEEEMGLLDELKSDTMVGDASSISKIIEKEKKLDGTTTLTEDLDKSFFGKNFGFNKNDFIDGVKPKSKKKIIIIIIIVVLFVLIGLATLGYFMFFKK